jgi:hypothetical protein
VQQIIGQEMDHVSGYDSDIAQERTSGETHFERRLLLHEALTIQPRQVQLLVKLPADDFNRNGCQMWSRFESS